MPVRQELERIKIYALSTDFASDWGKLSIASLNFRVRPNAVAVRWPSMADTIETLYAEMEAAARRLDFEEAKRCRDRISLMRGGASADEAEQADVSGLVRQQPGAMGLGTSPQRMTPPSGWRPPPKPDPMTAGRSARSQRRRP